MEMKYSALIVMMVASVAVISLLAVSFHPRSQDFQLTMEQQNLRGQAFTSIGSQQIRMIDVIIAAGQSNARTKGTDGSLLPFDRVDQEILFSYDVHAAGIPVQDYWSQGIVPIGNRFGPDHYAARVIKKSGRNVAVIKFSQGATSLWQDWNPLDPDGLYQEMVPFVDDLLQDLRDAGYSPSVRLFMWTQGEGDLGQADQYYDNLNLLVSSVRRDFGNQVSFGITELKKECNNENNCPWMDTLKDAQHRAASENPNTYIIETDDLTFADGIHFDTESTITMGIRHGDAYLENRGMGSR